MTCCSLPRVSQKRKSTYLTSFSLMIFRTSLGCRHGSSGIMIFFLKQQASVHCRPCANEHGLYNQWVSGKLGDYDRADRTILVRCTRAAHQLGAARGPCCGRLCAHRDRADILPRSFCRLRHALTPYGDTKNRPPARHLPGPDPRAAAVLGRPGLRAAAAARHGGGRRHLPHGHLPALHRPGTLERGLCAALAAAHRRPLWREPVPAAALLPVPGGDQALAAWTSSTSI